MICRIEFNDGVDLPNGPSLLDAYLGGLVVANYRDLEPLQVGTHIVTPQIWTTHLYEHEVTVLDNEEGIYRLIPRHHDSGFFEIEGSAGPSPVTRGASERRINSELPSVIIAGMHKAKDKLQIFGALFYIAGK